jgi:tetratricopeptide (TPR) repeat protein
VTLHLSGCDKLPFGKQRPAPAETQKAPPTSAAPDKLSFVGREKCGKCHEDVAQGYAWSAHDRSTELAQGEAVEAPFEGEALSDKDTQAKFARKNGAPTITWTKERPVEWTIGYAPLQQYILPGDRGRYQVFFGAFDSRNKGDGGKRWYFLDPSDEAPERDGHFQRSASVWNADCARCHSSGVLKNYDIEKDAYDTKFQDIDVSCEACHGPASRHVAFAEQNAHLEKWPDTIENAGFARALSPYALRRWARNPDEKVARLIGEGEAPPEKTDELSICAPCHSTSVDLGPSSEGYAHSQFEERFALRLIDEELFFADGQAKRDAATYNAFAQTKKHRAGVVCSDCHDPHAGTLRMPARELCSSCHSPDFYESKAHTLHDTRHEVACVDCHMPEKPFLGTDTARDHSFPIPRPDLALSLPLPNACETCHSHRPKWIATNFEEKFGRDLPAPTALAFHAASEGSQDAPEKLSQVFTDKSTAEIVRASALKRWADLGRTTPELVAKVERAAQDESALVRRVAAEVSPVLSPETRLSTLASLLTDSARPVRIAAALAFLTLPLPEKRSDALRKALEEAKAAQIFQGDKIEGLLALATIEERLGNEAAARRYYELALQRHKGDPRAFSALAQAYERLKNDEKAQNTVLQGLKLHPKDATLLLSRGRYLVRQGNEREALPHLQGAFESAPRSLRREVGAEYASLVHRLGDWAEAMAILRLLKREYPEDVGVQRALDVLVAARSHQ